MIGTTAHSGAETFSPNVAGVTPLPKQVVPVSPLIDHRNRVLVVSLRKNRVVQRLCRYGADKRGRKPYGRVLGRETVELLAPTNLCLSAGWQRQYGLKIHLLKLRGQAPMAPLPGSTRRLLQQRCGSGATNPIAGRTKSDPENDCSQSSGGGATNLRPLAVLGHVQTKSRRACSLQVVAALLLILVTSCAPLPKPPGYTWTVNTIYNNVPPPP